MQRLSFVIPNYNYREYVGAAIDSALAVEWPEVEVIVVDDGSTDDSVAVIKGYGRRVRLIQQQNSGPRVACNAGFARSTGDWVVFLDSDDRVDSRIGREIARQGRPGVSKIQFQMRRIDADGRPTGGAFPDFRRTPSPDQIRRWMRRTASYPTPPGSGNAYGREFLDRLFPLDDRCGDATDSACLAAAPFLGDVVTVPQPLVDYRVHGSNRSYLLADPERFTRQVERAVQRHRFAAELDGTIGRRGWVRPLFRSRHLLQLRVAQRRMAASTSPLPRDGLVRMLRDCVATLLVPGPESLPRRVLVAVWSASVVVTPLPVAKWLIRLRFGQPR